MIDIKLILEKPEYVKASLAKKLWDFDPEPIIALSKQRIELLQKVEKNKAEQNALSASVPAAKKAGEDVRPIFEKVKALAASNKEDEATLADVEADLLGHAQKHKLAEPSAAVHQHDRREEEDEQRVAGHERGSRHEYAEKAAAGVAHQDL